MRNEKRNQVIVSTEPDRGAARARARRDVRLLVAVAAALGATTATTPAATHVYTPPNTTSDLWSAGTNWDLAPVSGTSTRLTFVSPNTTALADGLANVNTNDVNNAGNPLQLNILDLQGTGPGTGSASISINSTAPAVGLSLVGTTPTVNLNALGSTLTYNINQPVTLGANTLFTGAGTSAFNFNSGVSGTGFNLNKSGASNLRLGGTNATGSLIIGSNGAGGTITALSGATVSVGSGNTHNLQVGIAGASASSGVLNLSAASSFTANVAGVSVGTTSGNGTAGGTLNLPANSDITASTSVVFANSTNAFNGSPTTVTTAGGGLTNIKTPSFQVSANKGIATFTLGSGGELRVAGATPGARAAMGVGNWTSLIGGSGAWSGNADLSAGVFNGTLSSLGIGTLNNNGTAGQVVTETATLTLSTSALNHLDVSGAGNVVTIGRMIAGSTNASTKVTGTLTIGNLDATSSITSTNNATAILLGSSATTPPRSEGTLTLGGTGTLTVNTTGSAIAGGTGTSTVNFDGLTLRAGNNSSAWIASLTTANIAAGGAKFDSNGFAIATAQTFTGSGGLTKSGAGTLTLSGASTYGGATTVNAGRLDLTGSLTSAVTINNNADLGGEGSTTGSLTFVGANRLFFDPATGGSLTAASVNATAAAVEVFGSSVPVGTGFVVLSAAGGITGTIDTNFIYNSRGDIYYNDITQTQLLVDNAGPATITWEGDEANPTFWDVKMTSNWDNLGNSDVFFTGDTVVFNDLASSQNVVIQPAAVNPAAVFFVNDDNPYTLSGGAINGNATLSKDGSNLLTISNNNTYTGGTTITFGTLQLGDGTNATGSLGTGAVTNNASLVTDYGANTVTLANAIGGSGTLTKNGSGTLIVTGANTYGGGTTISAGTLEVAGGTLGTGPVVNNAALVASGTTTLVSDISGPGTFTANGPGVVTLLGTNTYGGTTTVNVGATLSVGNGGTSGTLGTGAIANAGTIVFNRSDATAVGAPITGTGTIAKLGAGILSLAAGVNTAGSLDVGVGLSVTGGTLTVPSGASIAVGNAGTGNLRIGVNTTPTPTPTTPGAISTGTLDASAAGSFTVDVATVEVGATLERNLGLGNLMLPASSSITATTSYVIGNSFTMFNGTHVSAVTTAPGAGTATVRTPVFTVGGNKSSGTFTLGAGGTLDVAGIGIGGRAALTVGSTPTGGGTGNWAGTLDTSNGGFTGSLSGLVIGARSVQASVATETGTFTMGSSAANHVDIAGPSATNGGVVTLGSAAGATGASGAATGTWTIGNLDATSQVVSTDNGTGILLGVNGTAPITGAGTLNLNGGALTITTPGSAIAGGNGTSTVNFNGTTLVAGASSASWIQNLTSANVAAGGAKFDSDGFDVATAQAFSGTGAITKSGAGTLTLSGANTHTGGHIANGGTLVSTNGFKGNAALTVVDGAKAVVPESTPNTYNPPTEYPQGSNTTTSKVNTLTIGATGTLDVGNNDLAIDYIDPNSPLDTIRDLLTSGFNGGGWDGPGITSSTISANNPNQLDPSTFSLGFAENGSLPVPYGTEGGGPLFGDQDVDLSTVLVKFTWTGDLNLDGLVDFGDLSVFNTNYDNGASSGRYWFEGDFNYDGFIDFQDLSLFNTNYDPNKPSLPEPGAVGLLGWSAMTSALRRRRR